MLGDVSQILLTLSVVVMSDVGVAFEVELCAVDFDAGRGMSAAAVVEAEGLLAFVAFGNSDVARVGDIHGSTAPRAKKQQTVGQARRSKARHAPRAKAQV